jgi:HEAT repeat protein
MLVKTAWKRMSGLLIICLVAGACAGDRVQQEPAAERYDLEFLLEGASPTERAHLLTALEETGLWRPEDLIVVVRELKRGPPIVRQSAAQLLAEAGSESEARWIALFLSDDDPDLVMWSLIALKGMGEAAALAVDEIASVQLFNSAPHLRKIALEAAYDIAPRDPAVRDLVFDAVEDPASIVRWLAVSCLSRMGGQRAVELVEKALEDPDANVRKEAERAMEILREGSE